MNYSWILVLDFGGQYTQLIARAVRRLNVYCEIFDHDIEPSNFKENPPQGIILSGGPESVNAQDAPRPRDEILNSGIPILGICYGMQYLNVFFGGNMVQPEDKLDEYGEVDITVNSGHVLYRGLKDNIQSWMSHGDSVDEDAIAKGFQVTARTENHVASFYDPERKIYGVQFHPEVSHMPQGVEIIRRFLFDVCEMEENWNMSSFLDWARKDIQETVGKRDVLSFVSGGVDSSFVSLLLNQVEDIGKVHSVYIEALMRKGEREEVESSLILAGLDNLKIVHATDRFVKALEGQTEPEAKRKIVGNLFGEIQEEVCRELNLDPEQTVLAQGTLYTDLIESGKGVGKKAHNIKSHHNVGCEFIDRLKAAGQIVEPNRFIFKDEVRLAAQELGLPDAIALRQPFPGPGMAIRIVHGDPEWVDSKFEAQQEEVRNFCLEYDYQATLLPVKTVGVQGDARTWRYALMLTGKPAWKKLRKLSRKLTSNFDFVNRIVFNLKQDAPPTKACPAIGTTVDSQNLSLIQEADAIGREILEKFDYQRKIAQSIFVLFGADPYHLGKRSIAIRTVITDDFMTVSPAVPLKEQEMIACARSGAPVNLSWTCLEEIKQQLLEKLDIGCVVYDLTDKPPATTCWE